jgi:predicted Zn finger-like uncharacterized protein
MDVTCDNCKAEYDFDDTLLGDKGTTVKCSKCGHVFRVLPPRREPQRSALKVRFRDGRVESVASLRELQQRIQAGTVGMDDELGRDGFTFRRLGDVPELKNFFVRTAPASGPVHTSAAAQGALPHRGEPLPAAAHRGEPLPAAPKRTMLGVGNVQVPPAPRVPNLGPVAAAQALAPTQPAANHPRNTVQGRAPISSAPTAPNAAVPSPEPAPPKREAPSQRMPVGAAPSASGTAPTVQASSFNPAGLGASPRSDAFDAPTLAAPIPGSPTPRVPSGGPAAAAFGASPGAASSTQPAPAQRPAGPSLRIPDDSSELPLRPQSGQPARPHGAGLDSIAPGVLKAAVSPSSGAPKPAAGGVHLSLDEDEPRRPDGRSSGGSSKLWLYLLVAAVLGGGGWLVADQLKPAPQPTAIAPTPTPDAPAPSTAPAGPEAAVEAPAAPSAAQAEAPQPTEVEPAEEASAPEPAAAAAAPAKAAASKTEPGKTDTKPEAAPTESASNGREPKDYSGWVSRGDKLLKQGELPGAQQAFEQAVALRGTGSEANSGLGAALLAQGQTREAIPFLTRAAGNGFAEASVGLGDAYRKLGQKDAAIEAYETYLARLPKGARASYVKLQLEGLGQDVGGSSKPAPSQPAAPTQDGYRPAGELTDPSGTAP